VQNDDGLESSRRLRRFTAGTTEARHSVVTLAARCFGDAEVGGEQGATELVGQAGVTAGQPSSDGIAEPKRLAGDVKSVQTMMIEGPRGPAHLVDLSTRPR
jgi:hypothetical protein